MKFVVIGLSVTSSWGNGHATTYRALLKELSQLGHSILFLEKDVPYYAKNRDMPFPPFCRLGLYKDTEALKKNYAVEVAEADVIIVGSYDIDTPVTLAKLKREDYEYLNPSLIASYNLYLSFSGGPILEHLENFYNSPMARPLYCSVDPDFYFPENQPLKWQMGYLGTYSPDRQPTVSNLMNKPAAQFPKGEFVVAGPQYPADFKWAPNVTRIDHLPPAEHRSFYNSQKYTLNVTRTDMIKAGYSPSVRLFEAAACGVPIISDYWEGIGSFFEINTEILIASTSADVLDYFNSITEQERQQIGNQARQKVLKNHTAKVRAQELENYVKEVMRPSEKL